MKSHKTRGNGFAGNGRGVCDGDIQTVDVCRGKIGNRLDDFFGIDLFCRQNAFINNRVANLDLNGIAHSNGFRSQERVEVNANRGIGNID